MDIIVNIFLVLIAGYAFIILYFYKGWINLPVRSRKKDLVNFRTVSIIIPARNESERILPCLEQLLKQNYPKDKLEIIVVDDHSEDNTADIAEQAGCKVIRMKNITANSYKKLAVESGVKASKGEIILTTDADCIPGRNWVLEMVREFETSGCRFLAGPVAYHKDNTFFKKIQHLEFLALIGIGGGGISNGFPMFCNGANMGYVKKDFLELQGFDGINEIASGDDELLLHKFYNKNPESIGFCKSEDAIVYTEAISSFVDFYYQRKRWASKSTRYKNHTVTLIGVITYFLNLLLVLMALLGLWNSSMLLFFLIGLGMKTLVEIPLIYSVTKFNKRRGLMFLLPVEQFLYIFYIVLFAPAGLLGKYKWKGRLVK